VGRSLVGAVPAVVAVEVQAAFGQAAQKPTHSAQSPVLAEEAQPQPQQEEG
jgi:hypothetical protein